MGGGAHVPNSSGGILLDLRRRALGELLRGRTGRRAAQSRLWQLGPIQRTRATLCAHRAIPAKYVYRRRSAPYPLVLAWLIVACTLGKAWSLHMSYSCLALRLKVARPGTVHVAYQKI